MATIVPSFDAILRATQLGNYIMSSPSFAHMDRQDCKIIQGYFTSWVVGSFSCVSRKAMDIAISDFIETTTMDYSQALNFIESLRLDEFDRILGLKMEESSRDDENPFLLFNDTHTRLLCGILDGSIDVYALAALELKNRGRNLDGRWVGFKAVDDIDYYEKLK